MEFGSIFKHEKSVPWYLGRLSPVATQFRPPAPKLNVTEEWTVRYLLSASMDVIQHTHLELWKLYLQRQSLRGNGPYEIGFLVRTTEERYRKMVDLYESSTIMGSTLRTREHIMHLQTIEKLHWDIMHLANMLHEVEKKYKIHPQQLDKRIFYPFGVIPNTTTTTKKPTTTTTKGGMTTKSSGGRHGRGRGGW